VTMPYNESTMANYTLVDGERVEGSNFTFTMDVAYSCTKENIIAEGNITFPPNAVSTRQDSQYILIENDVVTVGGDYELRLLPSNQTMTQYDNRPRYELVSPFEVDIIVRAKAPTKAPTDYQPLVFLGGVDIDNETQEVLDLSYLDNEDAIVSVRIFPDVPFAVLVKYRVIDVLNYIIVESGEVEFPSMAVTFQEDIQDVVLRNLSFPDSNTQTHQFSFEIVETDAEMPNDPGLRKLYSILAPHTVGVTLERYVEQTFNIVENKSGNETLPWWIIFAIVIGCLVALAGIGYVATQYRAKYLMQKQVNADLEEDNMNLEAGNDAYFEKYGVTNVQENPLHQTEVIGVDDQRVAEAQMIMADDAEDEFRDDFRGSQDWMGQKMLDTQRKGTGEFGGSSLQQSKAIGSENFELKPFEMDDNARRDPALNAFGGVGGFSPNPDDNVLANDSEFTSPQYNWDDRDSIMDNKPRESQAQSPNIEPGAQVKSTRWSVMSDSSNFEFDPQTLPTSFQ